MNELYHHGIMRMKWGVRRYQNEDGSLTPAGKKRYYEVRTNPRKAKRDTKQALNILSDNAKRNSLLFERNFKKSKKLMAKGKTEKAEEIKAQAHEFLSNRITIDKKIDSIERGKLKAGRDFIVQTDWDFYGIPYLTPFLAKRTQRVIERNSTSSYQTKRYAK